MPFCLGRLPAVLDARMAWFHHVVPHGLPVPNSTNWRAHMPPNGVPILGNDQYGCCVWATILHYIQVATAYTTGVYVDPTTQECLDAYSSTGFDPLTGANDNGTVVAGPGGALEWWAKTGVMCAGSLNILDNAVAIEHPDTAQIRQALSLGPVLGGATVRDDDMNSPFMWDAGQSPIAGGHEFLILGHETLSSGKTYYDICTWDGMWRATDDWIVAQLDEACMVLDPVFFGPTGLDPADLNKAAITAAMDTIKNSTA